MAPATLKVVPWDKKPIKNPGIYSDVPLQIYHSANICIEPSISRSGLRTIWDESPAHYWCRSPYNPHRIEDEETEALITGGAAHHLLFGQERFDREYVVKPATVNGELCNRVTRQGKLWHERERGGLNRTVITKAQLDTIKGMSDSLLEHPLVQAGILNGLIEHSIFAKEPVSGLWLKARPDCIPTDSLDMADLKTCRSVQHHHLVWAIRDFGYTQQAGLLNMLCRAVLGQSLNSYSLVFVESKPPWCVRVVSIKPHEIERGERQCLGALRIFSECMASGHWPGPGGDQTDAEYIELDQRSQEAADERLKAMGM